MYGGWRRKRTTNDDSGSMERIANTVRAAAEGFGAAAAAAGQLSRGLVILGGRRWRERGESSTVGAAAATTALSAAFVG